MSFKACNDAAPSEWVRIENDGESVDFYLRAEPVPITSESFGKKRVQMVFPVVTLEGLRLWGVPKRLMQYIERHWDAMSKTPVRMTRQGVKGDINTTYGVVQIPEEAALKKVNSGVPESEVVDVMARVQAPDYIPF